MKSFTIKHPFKALIVFCLITVIAGLSLASAQTEPLSHSNAKEDIQKILIQQVESRQSSVERCCPGIIKASRSNGLLHRRPPCGHDIESGEVMLFLHS